MEAFGITVLSIFAVIGLFSVKSYLFGMTKSSRTDKGIKLILYIPGKVSSKLEGLVRQIFSEEIPQKLMTDGKLYVILSNDSIELKEILINLKDRYPIEVLPEKASYCIIQDRDNDS